MSDPARSAEPQAQAPRRVLSVRGMMVFVLVAGVVFGVLRVLGHAVWEAREAARLSQCHGNIYHLAFALYNYHDRNGTFPPAVVNGPDGTPWHSWRVLILPEMEQRQLYAAYNFNEPWNGPNNIQLLDFMPMTYACPTAQDYRAPSQRFTNIVAITGPGTVFPPGGPVALGQITDGPSQTVMLAEVSNAQIPWTAPVDLDVRTMSFRLDAPFRPGISSAHPFGVGMAFADASYRRAPRSLSPETLWALTTIAGGEEIDIEAAFGR